MATSYLTRASLDALIGADVVTAAEQATSANIDAVIASQCALADGYVASQVSLPPSAVAIAQVAPVVAELVYCALYVNSGSAELSARKAAAMKTLADIAKGLFQLHRDAVSDDPATAEDESADGAACGSAPRLASRKQLGTSASTGEAW